jgi:DNA-binding MurR/RpiR family transcriptional regulator
MSPRRRSHADSPEGASRPTTLQRILGIRERLSTGERRVAEYVLDHPQEVIRLTISELRDRVGVSYATISRFCASAGFAGYKGLRAALVSAVTTDTDRPYDPAAFAIGGDAAAPEICDAIFAFSERVLQDSRRTPMTGPRQQPTRRRWSSSANH